jgi:hypothetical protein
MCAFLLDVILYKNDLFCRKIVSFLLSGPFNRLAGLDNLTRLKIHNSLIMSSYIMNPQCFYSSGPGGLYNESCYGDI